VETRPNVAPFPRGALLGAAALITLSLVTAAVGRLTQQGFGELPAGEPVASSELRFTDRSDGAVVIAEARSGQIVDVIAPGTNGFLRSVLRGLARERKRQDLGEQLPFRLTRWADNRLLLDDEATGRRIDLGAFGPTNAEAFGRVLENARSAIP
jgi:putative photosynthetic complex assembly protein